MAWSTREIAELAGTSLRAVRMGEESDHPQEALRALDADLAATIERLQRARIELGLILRRSAPTDRPLELAPAAEAGM